MINNINIMIIFIIISILNCYINEYIIIINIIITFINIIIITNTILWKTTPVRVKQVPQDSTE